MKYHSSKTWLALAAACALSATASQAASYVAGDLLLGIRALGGQGVGTSYVVNIGQASNYRDAITQGAVPINGNFTVDLSSIYGANWSTRTDLVWGVAGSPSNVATVGGDDAATMYASKAEASFGVPSAPWTIAGLSTRTSVSTNMRGMQDGFAAYTASPNSSSGTVQLDTDPNDWRSFMASGGDSTRTSGNKDFGGFAEIETPVNQSLSLFRLDGPTDTGSYEGSFSLGQTGVSFVPEPASSALAALGALTLVFRRRRSA